MFSTELPERVTNIETDAFAFCHSLRNVAIPHNTVVVEGVFDGCTDLRRVQLFGSGTYNIINSLKHRFDNLPIHKMIYYQSYKNLTSDQLDDATNMRVTNTRYA